MLALGVGAAWWVMWKGVRRSGSGLKTESRDWEGKGEGKEVLQISLNGIKDVKAEETAPPVPVPPQSIANKAFDRRVGFEAFA